MDKSEKIILAVVIGVVAGCLCLATLCGGIFFLAQKIFPSIPTDIIDIPELLTETPFVPTPEITLVPNTTDDETLQSAEETKNYLDQIEIPTADLNLLATRLEGKTDIQTQLTTEPIDYSVGDQLDFFVVDENDESIKITATLQYETDDIYFWVENSVVTDKRELKNLVDTFDYEIYPTDQEFFGKEWIPGVDNDPHLSILWAGNLGDSLAGYTSTTDTVLPSAHEYSNAKEMFVLNSDVLTLDDPYTLSTMAHELQHLIHGYHDPNEELWLNEGFSELATLLNGYDAGGFDYIYSYDPDMQLNNWSDDFDLSDSNYGASFLFTTYMLDRFGEEITRAVVADSQNGFVSIDQVFSNYNLVDSLSGDKITADDLFADWTIANFIHDDNVMDGRYYYSIYPNSPQVYPTESFYDCSGVPQIRTVHQYGTDYFEIDCSGDIEIKFVGDTTVNLLPDSVGNDGYMLWSNRADMSDIMATREFDFSDTTGSITLNYDAWFDLEPDYDYVYLLGSVDEETWTILETTSCVYSDPNGNNYGCGYTENSNGWVTESVDLSSYAGEKVFLRFEYITDGAINYEGLVIDNMTIEETGYSEDFESGTNGWELEGFARIQNIVPQPFLVSLISLDSETPVQKFTITPGEELVLNIDTSNLASYPVLVVSGSSKNTRQMATYTIELSQ